MLCCVLKPIWIQHRHVSKFLKFTLIDEQKNAHCSHSKVWKHVLRSVCRKYTFLFVLSAVRYYRKSPPTPPLQTKCELMKLRKEVTGNEPWRATVDTLRNVLVSQLGWETWVSLFKAVILPRWSLLQLDIVMQQLIPTGSIFHGHKTWIWDVPAHLDHSSRVYGDIVNWQGLVWCHEMQYFPSVSSALHICCIL